MGRCTRLQKRRAPTGRAAGKSSPVHTSCPGNTPKKKKDDLSSEWLAACALLLPFPRSHDLHSMTHSLVWHGMFVRDSQEELGLPVVFTRGFIQELKVMKIK